MSFEWDSNKAMKNRLKHGVDFETATTVFNDEGRLELYDSEHSKLFEPRYITIGIIHGHGAVLTVVYTERFGTTRIISARKATQKERKKYYENKI